MRRPPKLFAPKKAPKPPTPFIRDHGAEARFKPFIEKRQVVTFISKGRRRTAEPYLLGYNTAGNLELSVRQQSGGSGVGWRGFLVDELRDVAATPATFDGRPPGYNPND